MFSVQDIVVDHGKIHVIDRDLNGRALGILRQIEFFGVDDLACHQTGQLLFDDIIYRLRKILIDGQVDIRSRLCPFPL